MPTADNQPPSFVNSEGKVTRWPKKAQDKYQCLLILADHFVYGQKYNENEVNSIIQSHSVNVDHALLRRELCVNALLARTSDGARYWRVETT